MPGDLELKVQAEKLAGPVHGYHLGCYAIEDEAAEDQLGACETKADRLHRFLLRFL